MVAGGGIGGLASALGLARQGFDVRLFEQAPDFSEIGAGIQVGPNMIRALGRLGVADRVLADAWEPGNLVMRDALDGSVVTEIPLTDGFRERFGAPYTVTHRADLLDALLEGCRAESAIELALGRRVESFEQDGERIVLDVSGDGAVETGALVGADGLWSRIRASIMGGEKPRVAGHVAYRAVLRRDEVPEDLWGPDVVLWAGPKSHLVHYPLRRGKLFNLVAVFHSDRYSEGWDETGDADELWQHFEGVRSEVSRLLELIETWKFWVLCDRDPKRGWTSGRVTLLGDAAHPTLQYLAQGAAMAIEDAVVLARELRDARGDAVTAFPRYEDARVERTGRVQLTSRFYGDIYHAADVAAEIRKTMLSGRTPEQAWAGMQWLYGHEL